MGDDSALEQLPVDKEQIKVPPKEPQVVSNELKDFQLAFHGKVDTIASKAAGETAQALTLVRSTSERHEIENRLNTTMSAQERADHAIERILDLTAKADQLRGTHPSVEANYSNHVITLRNKRNEQAEAYDPYNDPLNDNEFRTQLNMLTNSVKNGPGKCVIVDLRTGNPTVYESTISPDQNDRFGELKYRLDRPVMLPEKLNQRLKHAFNSSPWSLNAIAGDYWREQNVKKMDKTLSSPENIIPFRARPAQASQELKRAA